MIRLDVAKRSIDLLVERPNWRSAARRWRRGYTRWARRGYAHLFNETISRPTKVTISI